MSTENLGGKSSQTGGLKRLSKPGGTQPGLGSQPVVEHVPGWLKRLLTKYGEKEGRLVGLGEGPLEAADMPATEAGPSTAGGNLSALLEQMAEEGVSDLSQGQRISSVEWGDYAEPPAAPIDDFLSQLDPQQTDQPYTGSTVPEEADAPDWISHMLADAAEAEPPHGYDQYSQQAESTSQGDVPDWLTEVISSDEPVPPPPSQPVDAPDWLAEALEAPSSPGEEPPLYTAPTPSPPTGSSVDSDVPDWLTAALETPGNTPDLFPPEPGQPAPPPDQSDFDVPDWLADDSAEPALPEISPGQPQPSSSSTPAEPSYAVDVPDWLEGIVSPPGMQETDSGQAEAALDVPDWLADIAPPVADESEVATPAAAEPESSTWSTPDWITEEPADQMETEAKSTGEGQEVSSWFTQDETLPSLDWLFEAESQSAQAVEEEAPVQEYADWLFDNIAPTSPSSELPAAPEPDQAEIAVPSWLEDMQVSESAPTAETSDTIPDWLNNIQEKEVEIPAANYDQPPWLETLQSPSPETSEAKLDPGQTELIGSDSLDWLADVEAESSGGLAGTEPSIPPEADITGQPGSSIKSLRPLKRLSPKPTPEDEAETRPALPDWVTGLAPANAETDETPSTLPAWTAALVPPEAPVAEAASLTLPDWAEDLVPPDIEAKEAPVPEARSEPTTLRSLQRLSSVSKPASETPPEVIETGSPTLSPPLSTPAAEAGPPELESDALSRLSAQADEIPDWMAELSGSISTEAESPSTTDDWLFDETSTEAENLLAERLDWFTQDRQEQAPVVPAAQSEDTSTSETETPDWLTDLPELSSSQMTPVSPVQYDIPDTEEEEEAPNWLTDLLPSTDAEESPVLAASAASPEIDVEAEVPPWLADLDEGPVAEAEVAAWFSQPETEAELETPSWLTDLPETSTVETTAPALSDTEVEFETLPWLADFSVGASETADSFETPATETVAAPSIFDTDAEMDEELDTPSWLTDLLGVSESESDLSTPATIADSKIETELPAAPTETAPITSFDETDDELEMPSWLSELPEASEAEDIDETIVEAEQETLSWLTDLDEMAAPEIMSTAGVEDSEAETDELPPWLTDLPQATAAEVEAEEIEAELESPSWLTGLSEASVAEAAGSPALVEEAEEEIELETPPWLVGLAREADDTAETEAGEETPSWLAELPRADAAEMEPVDSVEETEVEPDLELPAWLTELPEVDSESVPLIEKADAEWDSASWLSELPETAETTATDLIEEVETEADLEMPSWLSDLPAKESEAEITGSIVETEPEADLEMPSWLTDLPEISGAEAAFTSNVGETEAEGELEMPSWFTELPETAASEAASMPVEEADETELTMPSWLRESSQISEAEVASTTWAEETETEELDLPSWLAELPEPSDTEPVSTQPTEEIEAEEELEIPPWLVGLAGAATAAAVLPEVPDTAEIETEAEAEEESFSWLTEVSDAAEVESVSKTISIEEAGVEAELEMPSWLSELPGVSEAETVAAAEEAGVEAELEMPSWLSELPGVSEAETVAAAEEAEVEAELEMPSWLSELPGVSEAETVAAAEEAEVEAELEMPSWLSELPGVSEAETVAAAEAEEAEIEEIHSALIEDMETEEAGQTPAVEAGPSIPSSGGADSDEELDLPPWLADLSTEDLKMPSWLSDLPDFTTATTPTAAPVEEDPAESEPEIPVGQMDLSENIAVEESSELSSQLNETTETDSSAEIGWLAGLGAATEAVKAALPAAGARGFLEEDEPETPAWLLAAETTEVGEVETPAVESLDVELPDVEPEAPDWLKDLSTDETGQIPTISAAETRSSPTERMSDWLRNLKPSEEALTDEDNKAVESTGVLAGLAPLLPVEKIATATPLLDPHATASTAQADAMLEAARNFYAIATQPPQTATLPEVLTHQDRLIGKVARAALYLLFIILMALPLVSGWQKVVDPATGQKAPWTEPAGALNEVLDKQRRELISVQLGVIDLQQPGSAALVSFDYSAATQGEMQPLAEAIIGRLRGQGMRLVFVSLEPEGAVLAQRTLDKVLAERNETYGVDMINLGYLPGQVTGIREIVSGRKQLSALTDFKEGLTFGAPERSAWSNLNNIGQIDVVITLSDNPATARWWIEQMAVAAPPNDGERFLLAATSATADPFLRPYLDSQQLDGLISGINGAAAIEAGRKNFGPARQMLDSQGIAHLLMVILIALGTMVGWMPPASAPSTPSREPISQKEIETEEIG